MSQAEFYSANYTGPLRGRTFAVTITNATSVPTNLITLDSTGLLAKAIQRGLPISFCASVDTQIIFDTSSPTIAASDPVLPLQGGWQRFTVPCGADGQNAWVATKGVAASGTLSVFIATPVT